MDRASSAHRFGHGNVRLTVAPDPSTIRTSSESRTRSSAGGKLPKSTRGSAVGYEFDWDPTKAKSNLKKHGVSFEEATSVFADPRSIMLADPAHSIEEDRFVLLGASLRARVLVVCYTDRPPRTRVISTRPATPRERRQYESPKSQSSQGAGERRGHHAFGVRLLQGRSRCHGKAARRRKQHHRARPGRREGLPRF